MVVSQLLAGYFVGAEYGLSFCYINDSSAHFAEMLRENGGKINKNYDVELRHKLFGYLSFGYLFGFLLGPGK